MPAQHVPCKGAPQAVNDPMGGSVQFLIDDIASVGPSVAAGELRVLATQERTKWGEVVRRSGAKVTDSGARSVDTVVLANGVGSAALAGSAGVRVPVYPLKGYSITVPIVDPAAVPSVSVTDAKRKVVYARIGNRLRVAGFVEIGARDSAVDLRRIEQLKLCTQQAFGGGVDVGAALPWTGLRPATPTSVPIVGRCHVENLLLNVGHGALGLTLAFGTARRLADAL